jgi:hypothetical protein
MHSMKPTKLMATVAHLVQKRLHMMPNDMHNMSESPFWTGQPLGSPKKVLGYQTRP